MNEPREGLILLNKPTGVTSFQALRPVKQLLPRKTKVGHTGTLDQFATGLLPVLAGKATRLVRIFSSFDKSYRGVIRLGEESDTLDPESEARTVGAPPDRETLERAVSTFLGTIRQIPPAYSAVHIDGERAYRRVMRGETVEIPSREVTIYSFDLIAYDPPDATVEVHCSKGTYVRALARDLAASCGTGAYLRSLSRTTVGPYTLAEAEQEVTENAFQTLEEIVERLPNIRSVVVTPVVAQRVANGAKLRPLIGAEEWAGADPYVAIRRDDGTVVAVADSDFRYVLVR